MRVGGFQYKQRGDVFITVSSEDITIIESSVSSKMARCWKSLLICRACDRLNPDTAQHSSCQIELGSAERPKTLTRSLASGLLLRYFSKRYVRREFSSSPKKCS